VDFWCVLEVVEYSFLESETPPLQRYRPTLRRFRPQKLLEAFSWFDHLALPGRLLDLFETSFHDFVAGTSLVCNWGTCIAPG